MGSNQSVDITNLTIIKAVQITPASSLRSLKDSTDPTMRKWIKTLLVSDRPEFQSLAQTNPVVVSLYLIIRTLQLIAILGNNIKTETLSSIYHGMFNSDFVPYIMLSPNSVDLKRYVLLGCSVCILSISAGLVGLKACGRANLTFKRYFFVPCCFLLALKTLTLVVAGIPIVYNCVLLLSNNLYQQFSIVDLCLVIGSLACLYLLVQLHSIFNFRTTFDQHPLLIHFSDAKFFRTILLAAPVIALQDIMIRSELPELDYVKLITFGVLVYFEKSHLDWTKPAPDKVLLANLGYQLLDFVHGMMVGIILVENCLHLAVHLDPRSPEKVDFDAILACVGALVTKLLLVHRMWTMTKTLPSVNLTHEKDPQKLYVALSILVEWTRLHSGVISNKQLNKKVSFFLASNTFAILKNHRRHCSDVNCPCQRMVQLYKMESQTDELAELDTQQESMNKPNTWATTGLYTSAFTKTRGMNSAKWNQQSLNRLPSKNSSKTGEYGNPENQDEVEPLQSTNHTQLRPRHEGQLADQQLDKDRGIQGEDLSDDGLELEDDHHPMFDQVNIETEDLQEFIRYIYRLRCSSLNADVETISSSLLYHFETGFEADCYKLINRWRENQEQDPDSSSSLSFEAFLAATLTRSRQKLSATDDSSNLVMTDSNLAKPFLAFHQHVDQLIEDIQHYVMLLMSFYLKFMNRSSGYNTNSESISSLCLQLAEVHDRIQQNREQNGFLLRKSKRALYALLNYKVRVSHCYKLSFEEEEAIRRLLQEKEVQHPILGGSQAGRSEMQFLDDQVSLVFLKVSSQKIAIAAFNKAFLNLIEEPDGDLILDKSINRFLPTDLAEIHDKLIYDYLESGSQTITKRRGFESYLITARGKGRRISLAVRLETFDTEYLYVSGLIVPKVPEHTFKPGLLADSRGGTLIFRDPGLQGVILVPDEAEACVGAQIPGIYGSHLDPLIYEQASSNLRTVTETQQVTSNQVPSNGSYSKHAVQKQLLIYAIDGSPHESCTNFEKLVRLIWGLTPPRAQTLAKATLFGGMETIGQQTNSFAHGMTNQNFGSEGGAELVAHLKSAAGVSLCEVTVIQYHYICGFAWTVVEFKNALRFEEPGIIEFIGRALSKQPRLFFKEDSLSLVKEYLMHLRGAMASISHKDKQEEESSSEDDNLRRKNPALNKELSLPISPNIARNLPKQPNNLHLPDPKKGVQIWSNPSTPEHSSHGKPPQQRRPQSFQSGVKVAMKKIGAQGSDDSDHEKDDSMPSINPEGVDVGTKNLNIRMRNPLSAQASVSGVSSRSNSQPKSLRHKDPRKSSVKPSISVGKSPKSILGGVHTLQTGQQLGRGESKTPQEPTASPYMSLSSLGGGTHRTDFLKHYGLSGLAATDVFRDQVDIEEFKRRHTRSLSRLIAGKRFSTGTSMKDGMFPGEGGSQLSSSKYGSKLTASKAAHSFEMLVGIKSIQERRLKIRFLLSATVVFLVLLTSIIGFQIRGWLVSDLKESMLEIIEGLDMHEELDYLFMIENKLLMLNWTQQAIESGKILNKSSLSTVSHLVDKRLGGKLLPLQFTAFQGKLKDFAKLGFFDLIVSRSSELDFYLGKNLDLSQNNSSRVKLGYASMLNEFYGDFKMLASMIMDPVAWGVANNSAAMDLIKTMVPDNPLYIYNLWTIKKYQMDVIRLLQSQMASRQKATQNFDLGITFGQVFWTLALVLTVLTLELSVNKLLTNVLQVMTKFGTDVISRLYRQLEVLGIDPTQRTKKNDKYSKGLSGEMAVYTASVNPIAGGVGTKGSGWRMSMKDITVSRTLVLTLIFIVATSGTALASSLITIFSYHSQIVALEENFKLCSDVQSQVFVAQGHLYALTMTYLLPSALKADSILGRTKAQITADFDESLHLLQESFLVTLKVFNNQPQKAFKGSYLQTDQEYEVFKLAETFIDKLTEDPPIATLSSGITEKLHSFETILFEVDSMFQVLDKSEEWSLILKKTLAVLLKSVDVTLESHIENTQTIFLIFYCIVLPGLFLGLLALAYYRFTRLVRIFTKIRAVLLRLPPELLESNPYAVNFLKQS